MLFDVRHRQIDDATKRAIHALRGCEDKLRPVGHALVYTAGVGRVASAPGVTSQRHRARNIAHRRVVMNKADSITPDAMVCVHGALMSQLGQVLPQTPPLRLSAQPAP